MEPALITCLVYIVGIFVTFFLFCCIVLPNTPPHYDNIPAVNLTYPFISAFVAFTWPISVPAWIVFVIVEFCKKKKGPPLINGNESNIA